METKKNPNEFQIAANAPDVMAEAHARNGFCRQWLHAMVATYEIDTMFDRMSTEIREYRIAVVGGCRTMLAGLFSIRCTLLMHSHET